MLETSKNVVWQSSDGRSTSDHCRVTVQRLFSKFSQIAWNVQKRCLTVSRRSRDLRPLSRDRSETFFKKFSNCLKRRKNVVWQSADGRVTSDHCRVTVQRLFSKFSQIAWNVQKTLFDSRPTVAWPPTTVAWPFSDFFQNFFKLLETSKKRCLTVGRWSRDLRPLSRDRSATFFKILSNSLKRPKNVVWQSADGRVTSDHCRVTVQRLFSKFSQIAWNVQKTLFDSRPTVAWPPTTVAWPFSDFFQNSPKSLETSKTVVWQSADGRVTSDHCRVTVQRLFSKKFLIAWNVEKTLFDSRPTVAWPPTTVAWPFSDFFQNSPKLLETSKKRCLTVGRRSRYLNHCRVIVQRLFSKFFICLKRRKNVVWQSADGRVTSDHCRVTVQWLFSKTFLIAWNIQKRCLTVGRQSRDLRPLSRDRSATFSKKFFICLKRRKNVVWQSADGCVTSDYCHVTVQRLFSKFFLIAWYVEKTLFDSRPTVAWPPTTVAWPFSDFFQNSPKLLETSKKRCLTVGRRSRDFNHCRVIVQRLFSKFSQIAWNVQKTLFDSRPMVAWPPTTVAWPFSVFFLKKILFAWNVEKTLFDSRPMVAWPPTTVAWPFSDFFQKLY